MAAHKEVAHAYVRRLIFNIMHTGMCEQIGYESTSSPCLHQFSACGENTRVVFLIRGRNGRDASRLTIFEWKKRLSVV